MKLAILAMMATCLAFGQVAPKPTIRVTDPAWDKLAVVCKEAQDKAAAIDPQRKFAVVCSEQMPPLPPEREHDATIKLTSAEKSLLRNYRALEDTAWAAEYNFERKVFKAHGVLFVDTGLWNPKSPAFSNSKCDLTPMIIMGTEHITLSQISVGSEKDQTCKIWRGEIYNRLGLAASR